MKRNKKFVLTAIISWLVGCLPMILLYEVFGGREYANSIPGCKGYWDFLAVKYGDQFCLPLLNASLLLSSDFNGVSDARYKKKCIVAACIGLIVGVVIQTSWVLPFRTEGFPGNWSFYMSSKGIIFNAAGWYHALFFVAQLGFLSYLFTCDWISGVVDKKQKYQQAFRAIALVTGTVFLCFHNLDDYEKYGNWSVIVITILSSLFISGIYIFSQVFFRKICNKKY